MTTTDGQVAVEPVPSVFVASSPELEDVTGRYFERNCVAVDASSVSYDHELAAQLWNKAVELTGMSADIE